MSATQWKPFDPQEVLGTSWSFAPREVERDERSLSLSEEDVLKAIFPSTLKKKEQYIVGEERLYRLKRSGSIRMCADICQHFLENPDKIPEGWSTPLGDSNRFNIFDGDVFLRDGVVRHVLFHHYKDRAWHFGLFPLSMGFNMSCPSIVLRP